MNKSLIAAVGALALLALAVYFGLDRQQQYTPQNAGPSIDSITQKVARASTFILTRGEQRLTLMQGDAGWVLEESGNYPIRLSELRNLIDKVQHSQRLEPRSSDANNYPSYGLDAAQLSSFSALDDNNNQLFTLKIGSRMSQLNGYYALLDDNPQVWVISGELSIATSPRDWLVRELTDIAADEIQQIELPAATLINQQGTMVVRNPGTNPPNQPNINQVAGALDNLQLLDAREVQPDLSGDSKITTYTTKNGLILTLTHGVDGQQNYWAQFSARVERDKVVADAEPDPSGDAEPADPSGDADPQALLEARYQQAVALSETLNQRFAGYWVQVPSLPGKAFAYSRADLLQAPDKEQTQ